MKRSQCSYLKPKLKALKMVRVMQQIVSYEKKLEFIDVATLDFCSEKLIEKD